MYMDRVITALIIFSMAFAGSVDAGAAAMSAQPAAVKTSVRKKAVRGKAVRKNVRRSPSRRAASHRSAGILVVDTGMNTRALEVFYGSQQGAEEYVAAVNSYKKAFGRRWAYIAC